MQAALLALIVLAWVSRTVLMALWNPTSQPSGSLTMLHSPGA